MAEKINPEHEAKVKLMIERNELYGKIVDHYNKSMLSLADIAMNNKTTSFPELFRVAIDEHHEATLKIKQFMDLHKEIIKP